MKATRASVFAVLAVWLFGAATFSYGQVPGNQSAFTETEQCDSLAEPCKPSSKEDSEVSFFPQLLQDQEKIWGAPWKKDTWQDPATYWALGLAAGSFALDGRPSRRLRENCNLDGLDDVFAGQAADVALTAYPFALWAAGAVLDRPGLTDYGRTATRAAAGGITVALGLKLATQRSRPHNGDTYAFWEGGNSFPSGHATVAWAIAAATVRHFDEHRWVPWVAYPLAGLISFTRISSANHYASDVVVGSTLGFAVGWQIGGDK
ncbi:MAG TPA: phosphatase PAP2 family protein [Acidobacteriota bacterium]|nr:phosphatase PAP2 family protein [Acidobacteriota bacterium]